MADQATVNGGRSNGQGMVGGLAEFGNDVTTLVELQAKLAALDLKESTQRALVPVVVAAGGLGALVGSVPVLLAGVALLIASAAGISMGLALLLTALGTMLLAAVASVVAGLRLAHSLEPLRRSREELTRNIAWIRTVLVQSRPAGPRRHG